MPNMTAPGQINIPQQQQQQQKGLLGNLFSMFQMVAPFLGPEAMIASKVGNGLFNPSASSIGGAISSVAGMMGDEDGDGQSDSMDKEKTGFVGPMDIGPTGVDQSKQGGGGPQGGSSQGPGEVKPADSNPETESAEEDKKEGQEESTDMFSTMSVRDLFNNYPGSEHLFQTYLNHYQG